MWDSKRHTFFGDKCWKNRTRRIRQWDIDSSRDKPLWFLYRHIGDWWSPAPMRRWSEFLEKNRKQSIRNKFWPEIRELNRSWKKIETMMVGLATTLPEAAILLEEFLDIEDSLLVFNKKAVDPEDDTEVFKEAFRKIIRILIKLPPAYFTRAVLFNDLGIPGYLVGEVNQKLTDQRQLDTV